MWEFIVVVSKVKYYQFKSKNFIFSSTIHSRIKEKSSILITIIHSVNSGFNYSETFITFQQLKILDIQLMLQRNQKTTMLVSKYLLILANLDRISFFFFLEKEVSKLKFVPSFNILCKSLHTCVIILIAIQRIIYNIVKRGIIIPHRFKAKRRSFMFVR